MFKEPDFYGYFAILIMASILVLSVAGALVDKYKNK